MTDAALATIRSWDELLNAFRARADALDISRATIDAVAGLQNGYASKLLAPTPIRNLSRMSFGAMIGALGLKLVMHEDREALAKIEARLERRRLHTGNASDSMLPLRRKKRCGVWKNSSEWSRIMNGRRTLKLSPEQRSRLARKAALARWRKERLKRKVPSPAVPPSTEPAAA